MSLQITAETFDELSEKMAMYAMENFKCNSSRVDDVELTCFSTVTDNIRAHITERTKKMIQLRRMYVNENEIDRSHREMVKNGTGTFNFNPSIILTKEGYSRSRWQFPESMQGIPISHNPNGWKKDYFQSAARGQEFILSCNDAVLEWIMPMFEANRKQ